MPQCHLRGCLGVLMDEVPWGHSESFLSGRQGWFVLTLPPEVTGERGKVGVGCGGWGIYFCRALFLPASLGVLLGEKGGTPHVVWAACGDGVGASGRSPEHLLSWTES